MNRRSRGPAIILTSDSWLLASHCGYQGRSPCLVRRIYVSRKPRPKFEGTDYHSPTPAFVIALVICAGARFR